ncbi:MAG: DUF5647 family protein [Thermomicrobiales bacterium]
MSTRTSTTDPATVATVERNLDLAQGYLLAMLDDPARMERVPGGASLVLLPRDEPDGFEANLNIAVALARKGRNVYVRHVERDGRPVERPNPRDRD